MAIQVLRSHALNNGTHPLTINTDIQQTDSVSFSEKREIRILAITASGWVVAARDSGEGGSRNAQPMVLVTLEGENPLELVGPLYTSLQFTDVTGIKLHVWIPHLVLADPTHHVTWRYSVKSACYYELL